MEVFIVFTLLGSVLAQGNRYLSVTSIILPEISNSHFIAFYLVDSNFGFECYSQCAGRPCVQRTIPVGPNNFQVL